MQIILRSRIYEAAIIYLLFLPNYEFYFTNPDVLYGNIILYWFVSRKRIYAFKIWKIESVYLMY